MKKIITTAVTFAFILAFSSTAFADNAVSQMATTKGGQMVAQCAQAMEKGVSSCAQKEQCAK